MTLQACPFSRVVQVQEPMLLLMKRGTTSFEQRVGLQVVRETHRPGAVTLVAAGCDHDDVRWAAGAPVEFLAVDLPSATTRELLEDGSPLDGRTPSRFGVDDHHLRALVENLAGHCSDGQPYGRLYSEGLSHALLAYVAGRYGDAPNDGLRSGGLSKLQRVRLSEFIDMNLGSDIGLAEMSSVVGLSPRHFSRIFKRTFGMPAYQYVLNQRVAAARQMLEHGTQPLVQVATDCGFSSQAHFNAVFRRLTGQTPGQYRRERSFRPLAALAA